MDGVLSTLGCGLGTEHARVRIEVISQDRTVGSRSPASGAEQLCVRASPWSSERGRGWWTGWAGTVPKQEVRVRRSRLLNGAGYGGPGKVGSTFQLKYSKKKALFRLLF